MEAVGIVVAIIIFLSFILLAWQGHRITCLKKDVEAQQKTQDKIIEKVNVLLGNTGEIAVHGQHTVKSLDKLVDKTDECFKETGKQLTEIAYKLNNGFGKQ